MSLPRKRFYRDVLVFRPSLAIAGGGRAGEGYLILLDRKTVNTPAGAPLLLPNLALAEAVAEEWRAQGEKIRPESMVLTRLAHIAIDRVARDRNVAVDQILAFSRSDLVCYRAGAQTELADRQTRAWDPLLQWADSVHGAKLKTGSGVAFIEQPEEAVHALESAIAAHDNFVLAGLNAAASLCGSAIIALALAEGRLDAGAAFEAAHADEIYQSERWGKDHEAAAKADKERTELFGIARIFELRRV